MRHGIWGIRQAVRQRELDSHAKCPSPLRPDIERQVPAAGRCRALQPGCAACTSPGSSRSRKRWVTPHPLPPSPTHHYDDCPVVPASWGRVGQSPKPPVTRRGKTETLGTEGSQPHVPAPGSRPPGSQRGGLASCATHQRSSTDNSPALARRPGISHPHCLADVEIQAPDAEK